MLEMNAKDILKACNEKMKYLAAEMEQKLHDPTCNAYQYALLEGQWEAYMDMTVMILGIRECAEMK